jgi:hypothetical protein
MAHQIICSMRYSLSGSSVSPFHSCREPLAHTEETGPSRWRELSASAGDAVRSRGATLMETRNRPPCICCALLVSLPHHIHWLLLLGLGFETPDTAKARSMSL